MKREEQTPDNDPLSAVLREWTVDPTLASNFKEEVWRRIERPTTAPAPRSLTVLGQLTNWLERQIPRPAVALAYLGLMLLAGAVVGVSHARRESHRLGAELSARYVQAIDPYHTTSE